MTPTKRKDYDAETSIRVQPLNISSMLDVTAEDSPLQTGNLRKKARTGAVIVDDEEDEVKSDDDELPSLQKILSREAFRNVNKLINYVNSLK
jgi:hypothetical protein